MRYPRKTVELVVSRKLFSKEASPDVKNSVTIIHANNNLSSKLFANISKSQTVIFLQLNKYDFL